MKDSTKLICVGLLVIASCFGCGDDLPPLVQPPQGDWVGQPVAPPEPQACQFTENDVKNSIGLVECEPRTETDAGCYFCYGEFVVPPEGCFAWPGTGIESFCLNPTGQKRCEAGPRWPCLEPWPQNP